ncbi:hypothetical protein K490DRAFT_62939 [Saccharata proteae CBS 121410]|uniref:PAZ domain-containing protein n=1 Tax=Saccharata proteae CBS 121410 TaxID=1314787 RepID=A0A9P4HVT1_9PEZI|nr:hypothetical protein K490DRAFT_62939 [Saccharata proteae CBS 121410]
MSSDYGETDLVPGDSTIAALSIILTKFAQAEGWLSIGRTLYEPANLAVQKRRDFHLRQGVSLSIRMPQAESFTLDLHKQSNHFYPEGSLVAFVDQFCAPDPTSKDQLTPLQRIDRSRNKLEEVLKGLKVRYNYEPWMPGDARAPGILPQDHIPTRGRVRAIVGIGGRAKEVFFTRETENGESVRISVKSHFNKNVLSADSPLDRPELPLINTGSVAMPVWVPMELLHIVANQPLCNTKGKAAPLPEYNDKQGVNHHPCSLMKMQVQEELGRKKGSKLEKRGEGFKEFDEQRRNVVSDDGYRPDPSILELEKLKQCFGIEISRTPEQLYGHILDHAEIVAAVTHSKDSKGVNIKSEERKRNGGRWTHSVPDSYQHWEKFPAMMFVDFSPEPAANPEFVPSLENLITEMVKLKVLNWDHEHFVKHIRNSVLRCAMPSFDVDVVKRALEQKTRQAHPSSLLVVNINSTDKVYSSRLHAAIKRWSDIESGVRTLVVLDKSFKDIRVLEPGRHHTGTVHGTLVEDSSLEQAALRKRGWLIRKAMAMQGAVSHGVKGLDELCKPDALDTMIVGASISRGGFNAIPFCPSIASVVASVDGRFFRYCGSMRLQRAGEEPEILDLSDMMVERFEAWKAANRDKKLRCIIYYRSGASEEDFAHLKREEMASIRLAYKHAFPDANHDLQIVYIALTKGRTRFTASPSADNTAVNHDLGLVVSPPQDHRHAHNLSRHTFHIDSTPRGDNDKNRVPAPSTKYSLLANSKTTKLSGSSSSSGRSDADSPHDDHTYEQYERLTYALCHANPYAPCTLPRAAPAWHARKLANRGRCYLWEYLNGTAEVPRGIKEAGDVVGWLTGEKGVWPVGGKGRGRGGPWVEECEGRMFWL